MDHEAAVRAGRLLLRLSSDRVAQGASANPFCKGQLQPACDDWAMFSADRRKDRCPNTCLVLESFIAAVANRLLRNSSMVDDSYYSHSLVFSGRCFLNNKVLIDIHFIEYSQILLVPTSFHFVLGDVFLTKLLLLRFQVHHKNRILDTDL
ncbi:MAG: hypothetical protein CM15mP120_30290 [Pseudomonadota bacterium]|nr:MAG: hypothetical protein CM15mP120_30290 [Pseudomonadota bacterium]